MKPDERKKNDNAGSNKNAIETSSVRCKDIFPSPLDIIKRSNPETLPYQLSIPRCINNFLGVLNGKALEFLSFDTFEKYSLGRQTAVVVSYSKKKNYHWVLRIQRTYIHIPPLF